MVAAIMLAAMLNTVGGWDARYKIECNDRARYYAVHTPSGHNGIDLLPVVIHLHGGGGNVAVAKIQTRLDRVADKNGFVCVYPEGTGFLGRFTWNSGNCCGYAVVNQIDDVEFIREVIKDLSLRVPIDRRRIYVCGMSNGGSMAYRLASELPGTFAGVASVAGTMAPNLAKPALPVPVMHVHGLEDQNCPFEGGYGENSISRVFHTSVTDTVQFWGAVNNAVEKIYEIESENPQLIRDLWGPGLNRKGCEVMLVTLCTGGHTWPGGVDVTRGLGTGPLIQNFDASQEIWEFFARHRLP